jgi:hypothetical protein
MDQAPITTYPINDFREWHENGQLELAPKFQRRPVWSRPAKSFLIDTILRGMPIPPIFVRLRIDPDVKGTIREVVDGQQRLRAVLEYLNDDFAVSRTHNSPYGPRKYSKLPRDAQKQLLSYKFAVHVLEDVTDADILGIFARLNSYTLTLNPQEKRNAEFFGDFKQTVYDLALEHHVFWLSNRILRDPDIARMKDAEFVSELVITMLDGIRETRPADLRTFYARYDDTFPHRRQIVDEFRETINLIGELFPNSLAKSPLRRAPLFYSLFIALYDAQFGLPKSRHSRLDLRKQGLRQARVRLERLAAQLDEREPPKKYERFVDASRRATADVGRRQIRHDFLWKEGLRPR